MSKERTHEGEHESEIEMPEFDVLDMAIGFGIAASVSGQMFPVAALLVAIFITQKALRRSPADRQQFQQLLVNGISAARRLLPAALTIQPEQPALTEAAAARGESPPALHQPGDLLPYLGGSNHLLVIGHSRGGKTTLMHELARRWRSEGGRVVVADPDASPGMWPGCIVYGGGDDFAAIAGGLAKVDQEVTRRRTRRRQGQRAFPPLYLVLDEAQDTVREVAGANALIETIARRGGKLNVHAALGVQDKQVGTLGWEGKGDLRKNFQVVDVYRDTAGQRMALVEQPGEKARPVPLPSLPDPETFIQAMPPRSTRPAPAPTPAPVDSLLESLLGEPAREPARELVHGEPVRVPVPVPAADSGTITLPLGDDDMGKIKGMLMLGFSGNAIVSAMKGKRADRQEQIRQAREELGMPLDD
jgi:hypothetical protein